MPQSESATSRSPVEIWREIFQHFLGPSLSNPRHSSLRDYDTHLFIADSKLLRCHIHREGKRTTLRLISRNWKLVADRMGDQIVFIHKSRGQIPRNLPLAHAKQIYYVSSGTTVYPSNGSEHEDNGPPLNFGEDARLAQVIQVNRRDIILPKTIPSRLRPRDKVLALSWRQPSTNSRWLDTLAHEYLRSLVALSFTLAQSPGYTERRSTLDLPMLRYLQISTWGCNAGYLSQWYFPALQHLSLHFYSESTASMGELLHRHSTTIEELKIRGKEAKNVLRYCSSGLPRLKIYITENFGTFAAVLSQLDGVLRRTEGPDSGSDDYITIQLLIASTALPTFLDLTMSLAQQVQGMKRNVRFQMHQSWEDMTEQLLADGDSAYDYRVLIRIIKTIPDRVFDSEGRSWRTKAARRFEEECQPRVDKRLMWNQDVKFEV